MRHIKDTYKAWAFTLIEVIITLTILALIFTSVMSVFLYYTTMWSRVETNRLLQSNIKTIIEHIREDIRTNAIKIEDADENGFCISSDAHCIKTGDMYVSPSENYKLYVWENIYYLGKASEVVEDSYTIVTRNNFESECGPIWENCSLIKEDENGTQIPLSNSWVSFRNIYFDVSRANIPKVTMYFDMNIASGKGIRDGLIKSSSIQIQTTITERLLDNQ